ncbi:MAG: Gfo/Idh/MocA family oxidoreductase [Deltaproteobacteria bacterium]|nr:Gfo/Idh/MocA family oxidoreductase [Deltaproteobacteria bacterium]
MEKRVNVAVIGVGYLGSFHAEKYSKLPNVRLVGIVDQNKLQAEKVAERYGVSSYEDYHEVLDQVDAVSIAVPTHVHFEIAKTCLLRGIDVLVEKPMTDHVWQAEELIQWSHEKQCILQVGHLERFNPAMVELASILTHPLFVECHRLHAYTVRGTEVDVVLDLMIHDLDIILNLVKSPVAEMDATGVQVLSKWVDIANVRLKFQNGCVANITASRVSLKDMRKMRFFQPDCYVSCDFKQAQCEVVQRIYTVGESLPEIRAKNLSLAKIDVLEEEIKSFLFSVRHRQKPKVTGEEALEALKLAHRIRDQIKISHKDYENYLSHAMPQIQL